LISHPDAQGVLFLDELNLANPSVVASAYQVVNDHLVAETPISMGIYAISAGNGVGDTNNAFEDPAPLNNRRMNVTLQVPIVLDSETGEDWTGWAADNDVDSRIISFINWKNSWLFSYDPESKDASFPSPRMWFKASKMIKGVTELQELRLFVASCVGQAAAEEFVAFTKLNQKVDVKAILKKPELIKKYKDDLDLLHSIVGQIADMYKEENIMDEVLMLCRPGYLEPEYSMYMLRVMKAYSKQKGRVFGTELTESKNWKYVYSDFAKYLMRS
jgi:hypothetical protein